jgi:hypothetical protein
MDSEKHKMIVTLTAVEATLRNYVKQYAALLIIPDGTETACCSK